VSEKSVAVATWEALFRAQVSVLRQLNAEFPTSELSFNEYDVLFNLSRQPERQLRIRDLHQHLLLTQPSVSRLVERLSNQGLVVRLTDPVDGRGTVVQLTDEGFSLFRRVAATHANSIHRRVGGALSVTELAELARLCDKLRLNAKADPQ
jgi:DNA-binding MarR family transcriptional regulator